MPSHGFRFTGALSLSATGGLRLAHEVTRTKSESGRQQRDGKALTPLLAFSLPDQWLVSCWVTAQQWGLSSNCIDIQFLVLQSPKIEHNRNLFVSVQNMYEHIICVTAVTFAIFCLINHSDI